METLARLPPELQTEVWARYAWTEADARSVLRLFAARAVPPGANVANMLYAILAPAHARRDAATAWLFDVRTYDVLPTWMVDLVAYFALTFAFEDPRARNLWLGRHVPRGAGAPYVLQPRDVWRLCSGLWSCSWCGEKRLSTSLYICDACLEARTGPSTAPPTYTDSRGRMARVTVVTARPVVDEVKASLDVARGQKIMAGLRISVIAPWASAWLDGPVDATALDGPDGWAFDCLVEALDGDGGFVTRQRLETGGPSLSRGWATEFILPELINDMGRVVPERLAAFPSS